MRILPSMFTLACVSTVLSASAASGQCVGDLNGDDLVDAQDLSILITAWGEGRGNPADLNGDGIVDDLDLTILVDDWGCRVPSIADRVGLFAARLNYFELDAEGPDTLEFHFGSQMSAWAAPSYAVAGDFNDDDRDTVCVVDLNERSFLIADENDSDEFEDRGTKIFLEGLPPSPPPDEGQPPQVPLAGDWDGDGTDGIGFFHSETSTFYLRDTLSDGPAEYIITLDASSGFPPGGFPLAGDFDGDGDDELGLFHPPGIVRLTGSLLDPTIQWTFSVPASNVLTGDFNGNGTDTIAGFDASTTGPTTFTILKSNSRGSESSTLQFGYGEPGIWSWVPLAGSWQVPKEPVAGRGFEWTIGDPAANGVNGRLLTAGLDGLATIPNVQAAVVVRNGELIGERYFHGYDRHIAQNVKSVSKSVLSAIFGIGIDQGVMASAADPVSVYLPSYFAGLGAAKSAITIQDILTMRAGLFCGPDPQTYNSALRAAEDYVTFVLQQDLSTTPGAVFDYSTGLTHLGSAMFTEAAGVPTREFARQFLFEPIGISTPRWDGSPEGYDFGGAEMWMRPRDLARFGQLFLRNGSLDGQQIIPPMWVAESANPWVPECCGQYYGIWWRERPWSNYLAHDSYMAWGYGGQFLLLFPTWDLSIVVSTKWAVPASEASAVANQVLNYVDDSILTAVGD